MSAMSFIHNDANVVAVDYLNLFRSGEYYSQFDTHHNDHGIYVMADTFGCLSARISRALQPDAHPHLSRFQVCPTQDSSALPASAERWRGYLPRHRACVFTGYYSLSIFNPPIPATLEVMATLELPEYTFCSSICNFL
jgi:hypothetical protein